MAKLLRFCAVLATGVEALLYTQPSFFSTKDALNESLFDDGAGECRVKAGRLLFLHIMKAGGTSVDAFLACHCKEVGCSLKMSLGNYHDLHGNKNCDQPALCTTHGEYRNRKELCGDDFEEPEKVMTVFREPISRVFSMYNYIKEQGWKLESLAQFYDGCDSEKVDVDTPRGWLCANMINNMVLQTFATEKLAYSAGWDHELLNQAKKTVSKLDATFFLDDFDKFKTAFVKTGLVDTASDTSGTKCELSHSNPTDCPTCTKEPTAEEIELIKRHNWMDIALYDYAGKLPNRQGHYLQSVVH